MRQIALILLALSVTIGCAVASDPIRCMAVGDKCLELIENRQLTSHADGPLSNVWVSPNGSFVACYFECLPGEETYSFASRLSLVPTSGARVITLMSEPRDDVEGIAPGHDAWLLECYDSKSASWSPNSRFIAFPAAHMAYDGSTDADGDPVQTCTQCVVVMNTAGTRQAVFTMDNEEELPRAIMWSSDSRQLACVTFKWERLESGNEQDDDIKISKLMILDMASGSSKTLCSERGKWIELLDWQAHGKGLLTVESAEGKGAQLCERPFDGKPVRVITENYNLQDTSPNGEYRLLSEAASDMVFERCATGERIKTVKSPAHTFSSWAPGRDLFAFTRSRDLKDDHGIRETGFLELWLGCVQDHKLNHMCVALDADPSDTEMEVPTSWSDDCTKLAYISNGSAFLADLGWRELTPDEKELAGVALSEEDVKGMMESSMSDLFSAVLGYYAEHSNRYPSEASFTKDISLYLHSSDVLLVPGTDRPAIIQFFPPTAELGSSDKQAVMVTMDAGYNWRVVLYDSGETEIMPK